MPFALAVAHAVRIHLVSQRLGVACKGLCLCQRLKPRRPDANHRLSRVVQILAGQLEPAALVTTLAKKVRASLGRQLVVLGDSPCCVGTKGTIRL
jgi:hypothetical protein